MAFECTLMDEPIVAADGHTYNRVEIEKWLKEHDTSPLNHEPLDHKMLIPTWPSAVKSTRGARSTVCHRSSSDNLPKRRLAAAAGALLLPELKS